MSQAVEAYRGITATEEFKYLEILRARAGHDEAQAIRNAERRGEKRGEQRGAEAERPKWQEENKRDTIEIARNLFKMGFSVEQVTQATRKLTVSEAEELYRQMTLSEELKAERENNFFVYCGVGKMWGLVRKYEFPQSHFHARLVMDDRHGLLSCCHCSPKGAP